MIPDTIFMGTRSRVTQEFQFVLAHISYIIDIDDDDDDDDVDVM